MPNSPSAWRVAAGRHPPRAVGYRTDKAWGVYNVSARLDPVPPSIETEAFKVSVKVLRSDSVELVLGGEDVFEEVAFAGVERVSELV